MERLQNMLDAVMAGWLGGFLELMATAFVSVMLQHDVMVARLGKDGWWSFGCLSGGGLCFQLFRVLIPFHGGTLLC